MLKTINSDGSLKISLIGSAVPAGATYNSGLAYAPDGSLYVKLTQGALSGQTYNGGLACTPDGALYVANSTPAASATFRRGLLCRADGAVHVSDATVATVRHDGGIPKDNAGRLFVGIPLAGLAASFDALSGITSSSGFASAWADQSGNGRNLLQATGANQPIHLPFAGTKYGYLPGVAGNYFSTPDSAANSIAGDIDIRIHCAMDDWTPAALSVLASKWDAGATTSSWYLSFQGASNGILTFIWSADGGATTKAANATVATGVTDGSYKWVRVTLDVDNGASGWDVNFWLSDDGETWSQLGSTVTGAGVTSIGDTTAKVYVGSARGDVANPGMKCKRFILKSGIDGTTANDFDPSRWTSGSTFTASTGETWTINSTGSKPAQIVDRPSLLFDGAAHFMKTAAFTLDQPCAVFIAGTQHVWNSGDYLFDGNALNSGGVFQTTGTPQLNLNAGASVAGNTEMALGTRKVLCAVFNGASSLLQVTTGTAATGNAGAGNMGGLTLGAAGSNLLFGSLQANEVLMYSYAPDAATRSNIIRSMMSKHGVS